LELIRILLNYGGYTKSNTGENVAGKEIGSSDAALLLSQGA
jgi:hypothetical protein